MNYAPFGFTRIAAAAPVVAPGNPRKNAAAIVDLLSNDEFADASLIVFPELCISGYTCELSLIHI